MKSIIFTFLSLASFSFLQAANVQEKATYSTLQAETQDQIPTHLIPIEYFNNLSA